MNQMTLFSGPTKQTQSLPYLPPPVEYQKDPTMTRSCLCVAATGLGKTAIMAGLAARWPGRVMAMSHRFEINQQSVKEFEMICGERVELEQAAYHAGRGRVVVASVQSLNSKRNGVYRMEKFDPSDFGLLLIDEAHRAAAVTYRRVINHFKNNHNLVVVGVTATPDRLDGIGLGCVFEEVTSDLNLPWGIANGWLVPPKQKFIRIDGLDLTSIRTRGGDLDERQLAKLVEQESNLHAMAKPIVDVCGERKQCIVFTASVAQAHRLRDLIKDHYLDTFGRECEAIALDGSLSPQSPKRREIVSGFRNGGFQFLINCGVATEGFNCPDVSVIAVGRPTKSRALYLQMIGRGGRPLPGLVDGGKSQAERLLAIRVSDKPHCTVLDFVGQSGRHKLVSSTDILAGGEPGEVIERAKQISEAKEFDGDTLAAIAEARDQVEREHEAKRVRATVNVNYELIESGVYRTSDMPQRKCPGYLRKTPATEKQQKMMARLGYTEAQIANTNPRSASAAIDYAIHNPRNGFARWLNNKKRETHPKIR